MKRQKPDSFQFINTVPRVATMATNEWASCVDALVPLGELMVGQLPDPTDILLRHELYRLMYSAVAQGYFGLVHADPKHPDFWPIYNQAFSLALPNPDAAYYLTPIDDDGVYKISGFRETVRIVDFQIGSGELFPYGRGVFGPTLANYDLDRDAHIKKDGAFEVVLSSVRPEGYDGDWWQLHSGSKYIFVRQIAYDWVQEKDGRLTIDRLDIPAIKPRPSASEISERLKQIPAWAENWTKTMIAWGSNLRQQGLVNNVSVKDLDDAGGITTQKYIQGTFDIEEDEALIIETEVPKQSRYWMFQLGDELMNVLDPLNRQTSLNGYTARLDADGKFRAVVSAVDPGVPNWLDSVGYRRGVLFGRWTECSNYPQPKVMKVKVAEVRKYLPTDTPTLSIEERDIAIRARRRGAQLRRRW